MSDVTCLLDAAAAGDRQAAGDRLPLVYDELRRLAAARMASESSDHTLQPTALVHEAYLRLVGPVDAHRWDGRGHFFAAAAEAMRRILIERARHRQRRKHGGDLKQVKMRESELVEAARSDELLALDDALTKLAAEDAMAAEVVKLRFYGGPSVEEAASALGISRANAYRHWSYARAWLRCALQDGDSSPAP